MEDTLRKKVEFLLRKYNTAERNSQENLNDCKANFMWSEGLEIDNRLRVYQSVIKDLEFALGITEYEEN